MLMQFKSHLSERSHDAVPFLVLLPPPFQKHAPGKMSYQPFQGTVFKKLKKPLAPAAVQPLPLEFLTTGKLPVVNTIDQFKEDYE